MKKLLYIAIFGALVYGSVNSEPIKNIPTKAKDSLSDIALKVARLTQTYGNSGVGL